jgi:hypothetical protein
LWKQIRTFWDAGSGPQQIEKTDPNPHYNQKPEPDQHQTRSQNRISIKPRSQELWMLIKEALMKAWRLILEL